MSAVGHNSGPVQADRLKSFIDRIERMEEEQAALASDKRDIYSEAKGVGYDVKTMRKVVALRKMDAADRAEQASLLATYMHALGMVDHAEAALREGRTYRDVEKETGIPRSTLQRRVPKSEVGNQPRENGTSPARDPETGEIETPAQAVAGAGEEAPARTSAAGTSPAFIAEHLDPGPIPDFLRAREKVGA